jgi:dihydroflavonol-4-reductase
VILDTLSGKAEFGIRGGYNFVDVRDVCLAAISLAHSNVRESFIISGHSVSVSELYRAINNARGFRRKPILIPMPLVKLFMPFIKVLNPITLKALTEDHDYSYKKSELLLGYKPRPFEETLNDTLDWFEKSNGA